jgi:hypothetical protein
MSAATIAARDGEGNSWPPSSASVPDFLTIAW